MSSLPAGEGGIAAQSSNDVAPSPSAAAAAAPPPPGTSETATIIPSGTSRAMDGDFSDDEGGGVVLGQAANQPPASPAGEKKPPPESIDPLEELSQRCPSTQTVVDTVRDSRDIQLWFSHSETFPDEEGQKQFFALELWDPVREKLVRAIHKYRPSKPGQVKKKAARFEAKKRRIIDRDIGSMRLFDEGGSEDDSPLDQAKYGDMVTFLGQIGMKFVMEFQRLVTPPGGKARVSLKVQVETIVADFIETETKKWFGKTEGGHVYYVVGFFCDAGRKEAARRTNDNDIGECINALNRHYAIARDEEAVQKIRAELESEGIGGVTKLVDERCSYGGLKYPDLALFSIFSVMETVYSRLATPDNFTVFGGTLLTQICAEILSNATIVDGFSDLFEPEQFSSETICTAMEYYVKVFGNVRAKEVCYRYNSLIVKGATVALRPTLAAGGAGGGTKRKKTEGQTAGAEESVESNNKRLKTAAEWKKLKMDALKPECRARGLKVGGKKQELIDRLMEYDAAEAAKKAAAQSTGDTSEAQETQQQQPAQEEQQTTPAQEKQQPSPPEEETEETEYDSSDEESSDEDEEEEVDAEIQHSSLQRLASAVELDEENMKDTDCDQDAEKYME